MRIGFFLSLTILLSATHPLLSTTTLKDELGEESNDKPYTQTPPIALASSNTNTTKAEKSVETSASILLMEDSKTEESPNERALRALEDAKKLSTDLQEKKRIREEGADKLSADSEFQATQDQRVQTVQVQISPSKVQNETNEVILADIFAGALQQFIENSPYLLPKTLLNLNGHIQDHTLILAQLSSARPNVPEHNLPPFDQGVERIEQRQTVLVSLQAKVFDLYTLNKDYLEPGKVIPADIFKESEEIVQALNTLSNRLGQI